MWPCFLSLPIVSAEQWTRARSKTKIQCTRGSSGEALSCCIFASATQFRCTACGQDEQFKEVAAQVDNQSHPVPCWASTKKASSVGVIEHFLAWQTTANATSLDTAPRWMDDLTFWRWRLSCSVATEWHWQRRRSGALGKKLCVCGGTHRGRGETKWCARNRTRAQLKGLPRR